MARVQTDILLGYLHKLAKTQEADTQLLERFVSYEDEDAFAGLVRRHGPMVLRVCRGVLHDTADAEDAFQATFLVLVRKARAIRELKSVGSWLYKVAYRIALGHRRRTAERLRHERLAVCRPNPGTVREAAWRELEAVLHEEIVRLPERYRAPVVLCCLEGKTRDEAALEIGCSLSVLKGRLERGRELLRKRLRRRGLGLSAALGAVLLSEGARAASLPAGLVHAAVRTALAALRGETIAATKAVALVNGLTRSLLLTKIKIAGCLLALTVLAAGILAHHPVGAKHPQDGRTGKFGMGVNGAAVGPPQAEEVRRDRYGDPLPAGVCRPKM